MSAEKAVVVEAKESTESTGLRLSLKVKLTLLITTLLVLTVVLVSVFLVRQEQESLTSEMSKRGRTIARDLANASKNAIVSNDDLTLSLLVQDAMKDPDVVYVIFTDADGKVVAHPDLSQIGLRIQREQGLPMAVGDTVVTPFVDPKHGRSSTSRCRWSSARSRWGRCISASAGSRSTWLSPPHATRRSSSAR